MYIYIYIYIYTHANMNAYICVSILSWTRSHCGYS